MYKNYIFDFYGTLADIRTDEENGYLWEKMSQIYSAYGAAYGPEELKADFRMLEEQEKERLVKETGKTEAAGLKAVGPEAAEPKGREPEAAGPKAVGPEAAEPDLTKVFGMLYERKGVPCDALQARMTAVTFRAISREFLRAYDGAEELLGELRRRGKRVYLLSNAQTDFTRPEIRMLGLTDYFDGIFISSEQGCKKPSPVFFRRLLERFGLDPAECIMIGNDEAADIAGAKQAGMDSLYIHTAISPQETGRVEATYRVMDGDYGKVRALLLGEQESGSAEAVRRLK